MSSERRYYCAYCGARLEVVPGFWTTRRRKKDNVEVPFWVPPDVYDFVSCETVCEYAPEDDVWRNHQRVLVRPEPASRG